MSLFGESVQPHRLNRFGLAHQARGNDGHPQVHGVKWKAGWLEEIASAVQHVAVARDTSWRRDFFPFAGCITPQFRSGPRSALGFLAARAACEQTFRLEGRSTFFRKPNGLFSPLAIRGPCFRPSRLGSAGCRTSGIGPGSGRGCCGTPRSPPAACAGGGGTPGCTPAA